MSKVYIYKCNDYNEKEVNDAMDNIINSFNLLKNIKKNTKVVIKVNLVSAMKPDKCATTHPMLIKRLVDYLLLKGCSVVIGDSPGGLYTKGYLSHFYKVTEMDTTNAKLNDNFDTKKCSFNKAKVLKSFEYTKYLDDADIKINFCKLKSHGMMVMSSAVKNLFGTIPGTLKPEYHYRFPDYNNFANMLIDLNEYFKFDLNIVDAVWGMEGNGPTQGEKKKIGCILASKNPYELDYICSQVINIDYKIVPTIKNSIDRDLCDINNIELNDNLDKYIIKDFKILKSKHSLTFYSNDKGIIKKIISKCSNIIFESKPKLKKNKCVGCQKCANICPMKAITMVNGKAYIDRKKCIKCYCCQEFCPKGAMQVSTSWLMRMLNGKK